MEKQPLKYFLSVEEKRILELASKLLDKHYDELESTCRDFKWICRDYLPQAGEGYVANINVFEIEQKTIADIQKSKKDAREAIMKMLREL